MLNFLKIAKVNNVNNVYKCNNFLNNRGKQQKKTEIGKEKRKDGREWHGKESEMFLSFARIGQCAMWERWC